MRSREKSGLIPNHYHSGYETPGGEPPDSIYFRNSGISSRLAVVPVSGVARTISDSGARAAAWVEFASRGLLGHFAQKDLLLVSRQEFEEP